MKGRLVLQAVGIFFLSTLSMGRILYVDCSVTDLNGNGQSWQTAYRYLQDAIAEAGFGDQLWVAKGIYNPDHGSEQTAGNQSASFPLKNGVRIMGGFPSGAASVAERDFVLYKTLLSGDIGILGDDRDNTYQILSADEVGPSAVLDGFTICHGRSASRGAALSIYPQGSPTIVHCIFENNHADLAGGAISLWRATGTTIRFINCIFRSNSTHGSGGAVYFTRSGDSPSAWSPSFVNCIFAGNYAAGHGGAISGSGWYSSSLYSIDPVVYNTTFVGNMSGGYGGAIHATGARFFVRNCIFWDNLAGTFGNQLSIWDPAISPNDPGEMDISHCIVEGGMGAVYENGGLIWGDFMIVGNLHFQDGKGPDNLYGTEDDNLRLSAVSAGIDAGDMTDLPADFADLDGDGDTAEKIPWDLDRSMRYYDIDTVFDWGVGHLTYTDYGPYEYKTGGVCGDAAHQPPLGDTNGDCVVNMEDLANLSMNWMRSTISQ